MSRYILLPAHDLHLAQLDAPTGVENGQLGLNNIFHALKRYTIALSSMSSTHRKDNRKTAFVQCIGCTYVSPPSGIEATGCGSFLIIRAGFNRNLSRRFCIDISNMWHAGREAP
ncbi:translation initiation factor [Moniliophthora roreri]|nr:translation initiation factor [Moniliophthora roreri]